LRNARDFSPSGAKAAPGHAADQLVVIGTDAPVVEDLLRHAVAGHRLDGPGQFQHIGGKVLVQVLFGTVPGAVRANHDAFFHEQIPYSLMSCPRTTI
jgi:hypothetical protein